MSRPVRDLFNDRANTWSRKYAPRGKLTWRLKEFSAPLQSLAPSPATVLDFGCGTGQLAGHLQCLGWSVTACDIAENMIAVAQREFASVGVKWVHLPANWAELPFPDEAFDAVVASSVFEYVEDVENALAEITRVLRIGGILVFNVPNPQHGRRRRERLFVRLGQIGWVRLAARTVPRAARYLRYLSLSKNRFPLPQWYDCARNVGLDRLQVDSRGSGKGALYLFAYRKEPKQRDQARCGSEGIDWRQPNRRTEGAGHTWAAVE